jgi:hypothetical protein
MLYIAGGSSSRLSGGGGGGGGGEEVLQVLDVVRGSRPFCSPSAVAQTRTFCITRCATKQGEKCAQSGG